MQEPLIKCKIFISYTTLDEEISRELLLDVETKMKVYGEVYIDLLHNDNSVEPQRKVMEELISSDILIVLNTNSIKRSKWVTFELKEAKEKKLHVLFLDLEDIWDDNFDLQEKIRRTYEQN